MIPQENIPSDFKEWLADVQTELEGRIVTDLSEERRAKLTAEMLASRPAKLVAEEVISGLPDSLLEEVANGLVESLVYGLAQRLNNCLLYHMAQTITDWYGERLLESAQKGSISLHPTRSPLETARWLTGKMADESPGAMFCRPGEPAVACPNEVERSIHRIADTAALMIFIKTKKIEGQVH